VSKRVNYLENNLINNSRFNKFILKLVQTLTKEFQLAYKTLPELKRELKWIEWEVKTFLTTFLEPEETDFSHSSLKTENYSSLGKPKELFE